MVISIAVSIDPGILRWVEAYITDRYSTVVIDGHISPEEPVSSGLPQGSPFSPILFILYTMGVQRAISEQVGVDPIAFSDDLGMVTCGSSVAEVCERLEHAGRVATEWGAANGVRFDVAKTKGSCIHQVYWRPPLGID